jgi:hypothetical protein
MNLVTNIDDRRPATSAGTERSSGPDPGRLSELVAEVRAARPALLDAWEATALVESLGYTDARVRREFGFSETLTAGEYVYRLSCDRPRPRSAWVPKIESLLTIVTRSAASTLIYAVPWLTVFVAQLIRPDAMQLPPRVAPALAVALMFSLVWSGGCVQVIVRRGEFYIGLHQPGLAREVVDMLLRIGVGLTVAAALGGVLVGWYFGLFPWPALVLSADAFIIMSVLWMVCGVFAIRQQQWRVSVAFGAGFIAYAIARAMRADVLTAHLVAATTVLMAAALQTRQVFADADHTRGRPPGVAFPRLPVLIYWTTPYFWYGATYFAFLFADRLAAGTALAALADAPFGVPPAYNVGMELALLTLLVAASGVEVAGALFARAIAREAVRTFDGDRAPLAAALGRHHSRVLALALGTFVVTAVTVVALARRLMPGELTPLAWLTLGAGDVGYACLVIGFVNALVLFETQCPWAVVRVLTAALMINLSSGYLLSHMFGSFYAVYGLVLGAAYFAIASTLAVRRTLRYPDYAYAVG